MEINLKILKYKVQIILKEDKLEQSAIEREYELKKYKKYILGDKYSFFRGIKMTNFTLYVLIISLIAIPVSIFFVVNPDGNRLLDIGITYITTPLISLLIFLNLKKNNVMIYKIWACKTMINAICILSAAIVTITIICATLYNIVTYIW